MDDHLAATDRPTDHDELGELRSAVAALSERLAGIERAAATSPGQGIAAAPVPARATAPARPTSTPADAGGSAIGRRQLLRRMGYAAAGAATVGMLAGQSQAGAANGGNFILGQINTATSATQLQGGGLWLGNPDTSTFPLWVEGSNLTHIKLSGSVDTGTATPTTGYIAKNGDAIYYGNGTTWRSFGGPGCAGALYLLDAPVRVYDSRSSGGTLTVGGDRTVSLTSAVPAGASGAIINLTATAYSGIGLFAVFAASATYPGNSTLNYSLGDATATSATTAISSGRQIKIRCLGVTAQAIVDVVGYYL